MRILFFSEQFWPETNAPAIHVHARARLWASMGHDVTVMTSAPNFPEGRLHDGYRNRWRQVEMVDGVRVVRVKTYIAPNRGTLSRMLDFLSFLFSSLLFSLFESIPDVVISTSPQLFTPLAGLICARIKLRPHVFELRDLWPATLTALHGGNPGMLHRLLERLELWLYRRSDRIIAFTDAFKRDLVKRGISEEKIEVVTNGTDLDLFRPGLKDEAAAASMGLQGRFVLGYLGTLGLCQGLENLILAAALLKDHPIRFLIVGTGAAKDTLLEMVKDLQLESVLFLDRRPREEVPGLWRLCDAALVHLHASDHFSTVIPSKMYESMAMGLPILFVGPEGEASAFLRGCGAGEAVPPADPAALAAAILRWAEDGERRRLMGEASLRTAKNHDRRTQAERGLAVLKAACGKG